MMDEQAMQGASSRPASARSSGPRLSGAGPGRWAALGGSAALLVVASLLADGIAFGAKQACRAGAWNVGVEQYQAHCYTDIYPLYFGEGLSSGKVPYLDHHVEYPVIIGAVMQGAAWVVRSIANPYTRGLQFFDVTVAVLAVFLIAGVLATAYCAGPSRRWTALLVAFSPALILSAFINWDLIAMGLMMMALAAWAARRPVLAGVLLGLAVATKFYPVVVLWPLFLLCLRAGRMRAFWVTTSSAAVAWLVVNLPVAIVAPRGWETFYVYSSQRGADWGCIYFFFQYLHWPVVGTSSVPALNLISGAAFAVGCGAIGLLALAAPRRPRLAQLIFLTTAAFLLTNKVWSPQYVVWLVPLVVLARPKIVGYLIWQVAEIGYFYAIWAYLITAIEGEHFPGGLSSGLYFTAVMARFGTVLLLCGLVVWEALRPGRDVVRSAGADDPGGGVLAGAADAVVLRGGLRRLTASAQPAQ
ncbi:MAG TPA: glycosyltransferase 87 family protein [Streptosporangiaceae bacterium]|nr:glycosyltransferase 87 family protein [Streptosporangiaceae bacterium]